MEETRPTTKYKNTDIIRGAIASGTIRSDIILETTFFWAKYGKFTLKTFFIGNSNRPGLLFQL